MWEEERRTRDLVSSLPFLAVYPSFVLRNKNYFDRDFLHRNNTMLISEGLRTLGHEFSFAVSPPRGRCGGLAKERLFNLDPLSEEIPLLNAHRVLGSPQIPFLQKDLRCLDKSLKGLGELF